VFGGRRNRELEARLAALTDRVAELEEGQRAVAALAADASRLETLAAEAEGLAARVTGAVEAAQALAAGASIARPHWEPAWNVVYRADGLLLVVAWMRSGWNDRVALVVGPTDPPEVVVARGNSKNDINSLVCGVVRPGEHWMLSSEEGARSGWEAIVTPVA
jgi:hypothetical protein